MKPDRPRQTCVRRERRASGPNKIGSSVIDNLNTTRAPGTAPRQQFPQREFAPKSFALYLMELSPYL